MTHWKNTTGGGCLSQNNLRRRSSRKLRLTVFAALVAVVAAIAVPVAANADVRNGVVQLLSPITQLFAGDNGAQKRAIDGASTVDPGTTNAWSAIAANSDSTENIGRIWTDKSVFNDDYDFEGALAGTSVEKGTDSDFLVSLSAISSTSNLKSVVTNTTPLDIVLVLDVSGSMNDPIGEIETTTHQEVYDYRNSGLDTWRTYYVRSGNDYIAVTWEGGYFDGSWQDRSGNEYEPRTSRNDNNRNHVQFYQQITASESAGSKIDALKEAANGFAETFATMNDGITDTSKQHRISVVKFSGESTNQIGNDTYSYNGNTYNYSQVVSDLRSYTTQTVSDLEHTINLLDPAGSTRADNGLSQAERVLNGERSLTGARQGAQKVVIFFTDGQPNDFDGWDDYVATGAINTAHDLKQSGTLIYTIGVFEDADPSDTNGDFNRYMNAVSSNYPEAECVDWRGQQSSSFRDLDLGDKVQGEEGEEAPQYYFSATNAVGLEQVFKDITESLPINQGSGSPIEEQEGAAGTPGYLTFTDTLGSFMEVTGVGADNNKMYLAFADGLHEGTPNDNGTVWTFSGVVNGGQGVNTAYPEGEDLSEITVTVTKSNDLGTGDTITVKIPASLIPMRNYDVDTDSGTMTVSDTYPVRLFYGVSVKDGVIDALNDPQDANHDAVLAQTSADGKTVDFYSNNFVKDVAEGTTEASFTPSDGNKFYYYPVNTQLFIDEDCTRPATRDNIGNYSTLYYKDSYWQLTGNGNEAEEVSTVGSITRSGNDWHVTYQGNNAYIAADTPRADRPKTLVSNKDENLTGTAFTVLTPTWVGNSVSQKLGNNGKLSVDAPGDLRIDKNVVWGNASSETQADKNSFKFTVHLYTVAEDGTQTNLTNQYDYAVYETGETPVREGTIYDNGEITLAGGQYVVISDLPNGAQYTVTEQAANQNGFATTDNSTGENAKTDDGIVEGTIVGGDQQTASFTNTYHATEVTLEGANQLVKVQKNLTGREWQDTDEFRFTMLPEDGAPEPESTDAVVVDDEDAAANYTVNLSNITFENPGTFTYVIEEDNDTKPIAGIDYSNETYAVTITVVDNGTGKLEIQSVQFEQRADVDGDVPAEQPQITDNTVVFTNNYDATEATTNLNGTKDYTDNSGANSNAAGKFTFELKAIGGYATEGGSAQNPTIDAADVPMPEGADTNTHTITIGNNGTNPDGFAFQTIRYNGTHLNNTYIYEIREVIPEGATANGDGTWSLNGMTYDDTVHTVTVEITDEPNEQGEGMHIVARPSMQPANVKFTNVYDPTDYTLKGDEAIHGTKVLQGRQMKEGETFYFQLAQTGGPETVLAGPEVKTVTKDGSMDFAFNELTFSKVGEYTFTVKEVADDQGTETTDGNGMTYSKNVANVTIKVKDGGNGALALDGSVVYENQGSDDTGKAVFTNVYKAEMKYGAEGKGGINVTKQLLDRPMTAGEFDFTITGEGEAADLTIDADKIFQNTGAAADQTITMAKLQSLTFDETDAGKTYTFIVDETEPAESEGLAGVTYDKSQYKVEIEVVDNGNGTMHAVTTVTQIMDKDGNEIDGGKVVVDHANSDANGYTVPTFGFVNDYNPNSVTIGENAGNPIQVTKTVVGAPSPDNVSYSFTLKLTSDNEAGISEGLMPDGDAWVTHVSTNGVINQDAENGTQDDSQTVAFGDITFTEPDTYTFEVAEDAPAADEGWTFDTMPKTVTVVVSDLNDENQYDGNLHIASVSGSPVQVTNRYEAKPVVVGDNEDQLMVTKEVTGAPALSDFEFTLKLTNGEAAGVTGLDESGTTKSTANLTGKEGDDAKQVVQFGQLTFTKVGTYTFQVVENTTTSAPGWTYQSGAENAKTITVTVTDDDFDGQLDATTKVNEKETNNPTFTNSYKPAEVTTDAATDTAIRVTKKVTGHDAIEDFEFSLKLKEGQNIDAVFEGEGEDKTAFDGLTVTTSDGIKADATEIKTFGDITFTEAGDYTFVVDETTEKADGGWTYDTRTAEVTVHVKDNGEGELYIEDITGNAPVFENVYKLQPAKFRAAYFQLQGNKVLDGRNWEAGDEFTFTLTAGEGENVDGTKMVESEVAATMPVKTSDTIKPFEDDSRVSDNSAQFTFISDRIPGGSTVEEDTFTYTKPGTYRYLIRETNPNVGAAGSGILGVSYDQTVYRLTVKVTDNGDGTMSAEGTYTKQGADGEWTELTGSDQVTFTNTYSSNESNITFNAFKVLEGRETNMKDNEFMFRMEFAGWALNDANADPADDDDWTVDNTTKAPAAAPDKGNIIRGDVTFGNVTFTADNVGYTYRYKITEVVPEGEDKVPGVEYDKTAHYVTAKVTSVQKENEDGTFTEHVRVETSGEAEWNEQAGTAPTTGAIFTNVYKTGKASATIKATKTMLGRDMNEGEFDFNLELVGSGIAMTGTNAAAKEGEAAAVSFPEITYTKADLEALHTQNPDGVLKTTTMDDRGNVTAVVYTITYTVTEDTTDFAKNGVEAVGAAKQTVQVKVTDDLKGSLTAEVVYLEGKSCLEFVNSYGDPEITNDSIDVEGEKIISTDELGVTLPTLKGDDFTFTISGQEVDAEGNPVPLGMKAPLPANTKVTNTANGAVVFGTITYTVDNVWGRSVIANIADFLGIGGDTRTAYFKYTVTETGEMDGVTNDGSQTFTVKVVDDGKGNVTATVLEDADGNLPFSFENKYTPEKVTVGKDGEASISVQKTLSGRNWIDGDSFEFVLAAVDGAPMPEDDGAKVTITDTSDPKAATFGDITYDEVGTYEYTITETNGGKDGLTYDGHTATVTVEVTDTDADGKLEAEVTVENTGAVTEDDANETAVAAFTNTYKGTGGLNAEGKASIEATKTLSGRDLLQGEFTFEVKDAKGKVVAEGKNASAGEGKAAVVSFAEISYNSNELDKLADEEGSGVTKTVDKGTGLATYTIAYTVSEKTDNLPESVKADGDTSYKVTVTVKDNGDGTMDASVDYDKVTAPLQFKNKYDETTESVEGSKLNIVGEKVLKSGMAGVDAPALNGGEFSFTLKPREDNPDAPMPEGTVDDSKTVTNDADGKVDFGTIDYTLENTWGVTPLANTLAASGEEREKTFTYEVTENVPAEGEKMEGVTYDTSTKTITVTVKDDGAGNITVTTDPDKAPLFTVTNIYIPEGTEIGGDGQAQILVTKEVVGAPALSEFDFVLTLKSGNKDDIKVKNDEGEDVSFPDGGIKVSTNGLENNAGSEKVSFGSMTFIKAGTYTFEVKETTKSDKDYWTYDNDAKTITVTVTDNDGDGKLEIAEDAIKGNNQTIQNTYTPASVTVGGDDALKVTKKVTGGNALSEFAFKLAFDGDNSTGALADIDGIAADGIVKSTAGLEGAQGEQAVSFGDLTFKKVGVYKFTVVETTTKPEGAYGWTYDNAPKTITVTVTDDGFDGQLDATTVVDGVVTNNPTVENVYSPDASDPNDAVISVVKKVSGAPALSEFEFELKLTSDNAANVFVGSGESATAFPAEGLKASTKNLTGKEGSETASFDGLTFTAAGEYAFTVTELTTTTAGGWTYDNAAKTITVTVEDQDGKLVVTNIDPATTTIENTYTPAGVTVGDDEADLQVTKKVTGGNAPSEFEFVLAFDADAEGNTGKLENIAGLGQDGTVTVSTSGLEGTQGEETVNFGDLTFNAVGDYYFTVTETTTNDDPNWAYDNAPKTIVVHVTDEDHDGKLEATVEFNNPTVENVYDEPYIPPTPDPDPSDPSKPDIDVDKKLDGRDIVAGEFSFKIAATGDNADHVTPKALTGTVDASGNVSFSGKGFVFDKTGEYEFTVSEVLPGDDDPETPGVQHNGVTYDETTYTITAKVTKGAGNKLVVSWDLGAAAAGVTFHNEYEPDETAKVTVNATKVLIGRDLAAGEFTFELVDAQGNVVGTATNNADGSVSFSPLEFTEAGTYTYTLREVTGGLANVTYDTTVHTVTITVVDNGDGTLTATVTYDSGSGAAPVFTNTYKVPDQPGKPEEPSEPERPDTPKIPDAGDHTNVALPAFLAVGGAALIACACLLRLRKSR